MDTPNARSLEQFVVTLLYLTLRVRESWVNRLLSRSAREAIYRYIFNYANIMRKGHAINKQLGVFLFHLFRAVQPKKRNNIGCFLLCIQHAKGRNRV